ncbi:AAA family ATPase [Candidatus Micrarchaeota archaeon]|nr:AAA family ATPase [Candidatus Micrarchaeota archaeon]
MPSFSDILAKESIFVDRNVLSPHYIPEILLFREEQIEKIMKVLSPAFKNERPHNLFIYGKTGTGKTASVKNIMKKFNDMERKEAVMTYVNCKVYNTRYRIIQKIAKTYISELDKSGFGLTYIYEKLVSWIIENKIRLIIVLDEVDMIKELDDLIYTLTRMNDELSEGSVSLLGISNKFNFKDELDARSKSSLYETEMVFTSYSAIELQEILKYRSNLGFKKGIVDESAINLTAAITASENGDARYALRLLLKAGEIAEDKNREKITDSEVEEARRNVDEDLAAEAIITLPDHQQLVLLSVADLDLKGSRYEKLNEEESGFLFSGEVYEEYRRNCKKHKKKPRTARWFQEYLNDLEMLGLITMVESGKGIRGHTRLIRIGYSAESLKNIIERNFRRGSIPTDSGEVL